MSDLWFDALSAIGDVAYSNKAYLLADIDNSARTAIAVWTLQASQKLHALSVIAHTHVGTARLYAESWCAAVKAFTPEAGGEEWRTETFRLIDIAIDAIMKAAEAQNSRGAA